MKNKPLTIFFSGIGGSGVSAIASFMADKDHTILGSDRAFDENPEDPLSIQLRSKGISLMPQDGNGITNDIDIAVFSTAVETNQPEYVKAQELGIHIKTRPQYMAEIMESYTTIAVSGTSGKSTTAGMLSFLMMKLGLDPNFIGGGKVKQFKSPSNPGNALSGQSDYLVIEACESDGTIVHYRPSYSILLNLALDHNPVDTTGKMFEEFHNNTSKKVIINKDDENLKIIGHKNTTTFSIHNPSHFRAESIEYGPFDTAFSFGNIRFQLSLPGEHNLYNALACIALLSELGVSPGLIVDILPEFQGLDRRFDIHLNTNKHLVIDDYAHNPHKIKYLMDTVRRLRDSICYVFQPHGFGPTRLMRDEYIRMFNKHLRNTDHLILLPIFYPGGTVTKDISSDDLAREIEAAGRSVEVAKDRNEVLNTIGRYNCFVVFGARDDSLSEFSRKIANALNI